ncbi:MAG TPA: hypothetical protein VI451_19580 [Anaerolineales bacterium]|nr:hypothetical protein [Anaerolineales bacterium]
MFTNKRIHFKNFARQALSIMFALWIVVVGIRPEAAFTASPQSTTVYIPVVYTNAFTPLTTFELAPDPGSLINNSFRITFPFEFSDIHGLSNNPCTPGFDNIIGGGEMRIHIRWNMDGEGNLHVNAHMNVKGEGYDKDGIKYLILDSFNSNFKTGFPLSFIDNFKMISQGSTDNLIVNFSLHISPDFSAHWNLAGPLCRG